MYTYIYKYIYEKKTRGVRAMMFCCFENRESKKQKKKKENVSHSDEKKRLWRDFSIFFLFASFVFDSFIHIWRTATIYRLCYCRIFEELKDFYNFFFCVLTAMWFIHMKKYTVYFIAEFLKFITIKWKTSANKQTNKHKHSDGWIDGWMEK